MCQKALDDSDSICKQQLQEIAVSCDTALKQLMEVATYQDQYIAGQKNYLEIQENELQRRAEVMTELENDLDAWYRNPYIMTLIGVAAGALTHSVVDR